jgi:hypothetical protein
VIASPPQKSKPFRILPCQYSVPFFLRKPSFWQRHQPAVFSSCRRRDWGKQAATAVRGCGTTKDRPISSHDLPTTSTVLDRETASRAHGYDFKSFCAHLTVRQKQQVMESRKILSHPKVPPTKPPSNEPVCLRERTSLSSYSVHPLGRTWQQQAICPIARGLPDKRLRRTLVR